MESFYEPNTQEYLEYVFSNSQAGDVDSILNAIEKYSETHPLMHVGTQKGKAIDELINQKPVQVMIELGGYLGYSAVRFANQLPTNGHYYSFELDPTFAKVASKIIEHAGLSSKITIVPGEFKMTSKTFSEKYGVNKVDFVFIDHSKDAYVQDLKIIEELQWLNIGATVAADNILYPGVPEYVAYMDSKHEQFPSRLIKFQVSHLNNVEDALLVAEYRGL